MTGDLDRGVRHYIYRQLAGTGTAPTVGEIAAALELARRDVEASLRRLADGRALVLAPGTHRIRMAHPFSAVPTAYPVETGERRYWANCAWDALAIPELLGEDAVTRAACPDCRAPLVLRTRGGQLEPTDAVVHFAVPARRFWDDIGFT